MASALSTLDELLLSELECPICLAFMLPPISLCENGHNICKICKPKLQSCPTCRGSLTNTRCIALEKVVGNLNFPCVNCKFGCDEIFPAFLITGHEAVCQFSPFSCPAEYCNWNGSSKDLYMHVKQKHNEHTQFFDQTDMMVIVEYDTSTDYDEVIGTKNHVFVCAIRVIDGIWHFVLQCVGSKEVASMNEYTLTFSSKPEQGCLKITHLSQSVRDSLDAIYKSCTCVKLPIDVVKSYMLQNDLVFYLEIKQSDRTFYGQFQSH